MSVYIDQNSLCNLPLNIPEGIESLNWFDNSYGEIFKFDGTVEKITVFPAWAQKCVDIYNMSLPPVPEPPTLAELASGDLYATDWTTIPDITDPAKCTPTLTNQADFLQYRNQLRAIALGLQGALTQLPPKPTAKWSN